MPDIYPCAQQLAWHVGKPNRHRLFEIVGGMITIIFLGGYAAAQLNAGGKALHVLFGWDIWVGAVAGSVIVLLYCFAGGIRASIWTDAAQSIVMMGSMGLLCFTAIQTIGGMGPFWLALHQVSTTYMAWFPTNLPMDAWPGFGLGTLAFVAGWFMAGIGVIGQPHVMVRFMALDNPVHMTRTRVYYYAWYTGFFALTILTGLAARILIPVTSGFDAELALPTLSQQLLPDVLIGLILAGLFAATMSTADSQIITCSASLTEDIKCFKHKTYLINKMATVMVTVIALLIALAGDKSVFQLVAVSAGSLTAAFAPIILLLAFGRHLSHRLMLAMMAGGVATLIAWHYAGWGKYVYEVMPGIMAGLLVYGLWQLWVMKPKQV
ncbi:MAG: sodium/proline symporter [Vampirovibrionales bacterium]